MTTTHPWRWAQTTPLDVARRGGRRDDTPDMKRLKRILVVDDDAASCQAAAAMLRELGCAVETMADSSAALERLQHVVPDALLVDLNMPAMADGAFVQACHRDPCCRGVPVVVMAVTPRAAG